MTPISGNTFSVKDQIKALGGKWNPTDKVWMVPDDKADEARKLVSEAPKTSPKPKTAFARRSRCHDCGAKSNGYYRCYPCSQKYRSGDGGPSKGYNFYDYNSRDHNFSYYTKDGRLVLGDED